ncbi:MAG: hypothetical protein RIC95_13275 [Vicingaceae bacterium]
MAIKDRDVLSAIDKLVSKTSSNQKVELTDDQIEMLKMSEDDFDQGRVISHEELFAREREWLKEQ